MKKFFFFAAVALTAFVVSCKKEVVPDSVTLSTPTEALVQVEGGVASITFTSNVAWKATSSQSWVTVSPASGEAGENITIKASVLKNETTDNRIAKVTITAGTASATVVITQSQTDAIDVKTLSFTVGCEGGTVEIPISANVSYSVSIPEAADWIVETKGMVDSKVVLTVAPTHEYVFSYDEDENPYLDPEAIVRSANIEIVAGSLSETVTIGQKTFVPYFDYEGEWAGLQWSFYWGGPTYIPQEGADITIDVSTNIDWRVYFSVWDNDAAAMVDCYDLGWAHLSYDADASQIHLLVEENDTYVPRENYLYAECSIDGAVDANFGGLGYFVQEGKVPTAGANLLWSKLLSQIGVPSAPYHRLAYKTYGGDALLISDGENVYAVSPDNGTYWKTITWGVKPTSIASDDAGNVIVAPDYDFESGTSYQVYYTQDVNQEPMLLFDHLADFSGTIGSWRVRGDLSKRAVVTGFVGGSRYWAGWEIDNWAVSLDNYYNVNGQTRGPIAVDGDAWTPESGAVMSLGPRLNEGIFYRAYDTDQRLYYLQDAYTPNWVTPYNWQMASEAGAGGDFCQNNMDIIDYNGRRIMAYTQGLYWAWNSKEQADVYVLDVTNPTDVEVIAILDGAELASVDTFVDGGGVNAYVSADVKLHEDAEGNLILYVINSTLESLSKIQIIF